MSISWELIYFKELLTRLRARRRQNVQEGKYIVGGLEIRGTTRLPTKSRLDDEFIWNVNSVYTLYLFRQMKFTVLLNFSLTPYIHFRSNEYIHVM